MTATAAGTGSSEDLVIETSREGSTVVVAVRGEVDIASVPLLRAVLDGVYAARPRRVEVDLSEVTFLDSHVLTTLIAARRRLAAARVGLALRAPSRPVVRVLTASGLDQVFPLSTSDGDRRDR